MSFFVFVFFEYTICRNDLEQKHSVSIIPVYFDLGDKEQIKTGVKTIRENREPVDILVNNAGAIFTALFQMTSMKKLKEMFEINYFSQMLLMQYISRIMMRQKSGSIINISSSAAIEGNEGRTGYASAKAAMIAQAKVLSREVGIYNIRVNTIAPGLTDTDMMRKNTPKELINEVISRISLKRIANPEEIAKVALLLSSDLSS